jgi:hypothetical protein
MAIPDAFLPETFLTVPVFVVRNAQISDVTGPSHHKTPKVADLVQGLIVSRVRIATIQCGDVVKHQDLIALPFFKARHFQEGRCEYPGGKRWMLDDGE